MTTSVYTKRNFAVDLYDIYTEMQHGNIDKVAFLARKIFKSLGQNLGKKLQTYVEKNEVPSGWFSTPKLKLNSFELGFKSTRYMTNDVAIWAKKNLIIAALAGLILFYMLYNHPILSTFGVTGISIYKVLD